MVGYVPIGLLMCFWTLVSVVADVALAPLPRIPLTKGAEEKGDNYARFDSRFGWCFEPLWDVLRHRIATVTSEGKTIGGWLQGGNAIVASDRVQLTSPRAQMEGRIEVERVRKNPRNYVI